MTEYKQHVCPKLELEAYEKTNSYLFLEGNDLTT